MSEKVKKKPEFPTDLQGARLTKRTLSHKKRWTQLVLGWFHPQALVAAHLFGKLVVGDRCGKKL